MRQVPFVDLPLQYRSLKPQIDAAIQGVLNRCDFILGGAVSEFEEAFASYVGCKQAVGVASGTDALHLVLRALDVGPGDEVITVANTFIATLEAISYAGATPVLVDCDPDYGLIDAAAVRQAISDRTKAIIPVHLFGQPADMDSILALAAHRDIPVIEDAAQAHGARLKGGRSCGSLGQAAAFSFYPGKNLGAYGDGGAVTTNDSELAERIRLLRNWGSVIKHQHEVKGFNARLDTIQAAVLSVKLRHLETWNDRRATAATWYSLRLEPLEGVVLPVEAPWTDKHVYHLFVVRVPGRDPVQLVERLGALGVQCGIHYPTPVHLQPAYQDLGLAPGALPVSERMAGEIVSLPIFPEITEAQVDHVVACLRRCL